MLFGGAGREGCVERMIAENVNLKAIIIPVRRSAKLEQAVSKLRALPCKMIEVEKSGLSDALKPFSGSALLSIGFPYLIPIELLRLFLCITDKKSVSIFAELIVPIFRMMKYKCVPH